MKRFSITAMVLIAALVINVFLCTNSAQAWFSDPNEPDWPEPGWPEIFEPNQLRTLHLEMNPDDWQAILHNSPGPDPPDCILVEIELPAMFWMEGEEDLKIKVAVRRKKSFAFPDDVNPEKVALKIDINEYFDEDPCAVSHWHGMKKLSLEVNIDSMDIISEGVACNIQYVTSLS